MKRTICTVLTCLVAVPALGFHPNQPQGFAPDRAYQQGLDQIDQVDLFSGRLTITLPIGPFTLVYNSNVWRYQIDGQGYIEAQPDRQTTGGLGWHLGWGEVYPPHHWYNESGRWLYVADDGSRHTFYANLHKGEDDQAPDVYYTRDNSYLRLRIGENGCSADIEHPDGITRRFVGSCGPQTTMTLRAVWNRFGSPEDPDTTFTYNADDTLRTITDRHGRQRFVHLAKTGDLLDGQTLSWINRVVTKIDVPAPHGAWAEYLFEYDNQSLTMRSCKDDKPDNSVSIRLPRLVRVTMPDGTAFHMEDDQGTPYYHTSCTGDLADRSGMITGIDLPTGGKIRWSYQKFEFPPGDNHSVFNTATGVASRRLLLADDSELGVWTYRTTDVGAANGTDAEMRTEVVYPTGDCSEHFFNARYWVTPSAGRGWEYGLPFTYSEEHGGRYLSTRVFTGNDTGGGCAGTKLRSTYVRYRHDALPGSICDPLNPQPGCATLADWYQRNRQIEARRTVFHDDDDRYTDIEHSDFDGLGHFRTTVTTGTFWDGSTNQERRVSATAYSRASGTYPETYQPLPPSEPWVLDVFDAVEVTEADAVGETSSRVEYGFDRDTGALDCMRTLARGSGRGANDLITTFVRDVRGQVTDQKRYGGDHPAQALQVASADCTLVPSEPASWTHHTYQFGVTRTREPRTPSGAAGPFLTYDVDLDPSTGLVITSRDPSGIETTFAYDTAGRPVETAPQGFARTHYVYTPASKSAPATVAIVTAAPGKTTELTRREIDYDAFGRVERERRRIPGGGWSEQRAERNARGWVTGTSVPGAPSKWVRFLDFDAFGRPTRVQPPDAGGADVLLGYRGRRVETRSVSVKTSLDGPEQRFETERSYDRQGRLRAVVEPSGTGSTSTTTTYAYDVGARMTRIRTLGTPLQERAYTYDNRGFLLAERHPEKGLVGNGTVAFHDFDVHGNAGRKVDGSHDLEFTFDDLGRLTDTRDRNRGGRLVSRVEYDTAPGAGLGKVWRTTRYNYLDLPWTTTSAEERVFVRRVMRYNHASAPAPGTARRQETVIVWPDGSDRFAIDYTYDMLGKITALGYPRCTSPSCAGTSAAAAPTVDSTYEEGVLTAIDGWAGGIAYDSGGTVTRVDHANAVSEIYTVDPDRRSRPTRIRVEGGSAATPLFDSGVYTYDGAGNVTAIGSERFAYDGVHRLTAARVWDDNVEQSYAYDRVGNLTAITTDGVARFFTVDGATNRLSGSIAYDSAGNVTQWGGYTFGYDTANRLISQAHMRYLYDASGERVVSVPNTPDRTVIYHLRDLGKRRLSRVVQANGTFSRERDWVWLGGRLLGRLDTPSGQRFHYHPDHLGTPRLITDAQGVVRAEQRLLPYGEEFPGPTTFDEHKLAGHERDASTGADSMHARHYHSGLGRFLSVDELPGDASTPQSLNRYAYVMGRPTLMNDPDGMAGDYAYGPSSNIYADIMYLLAGDSRNPVVFFEKTVIWGVAAAGAVPAGFLLDIVISPFRLDASYNRELTAELGYTVLPVTGAVVEGLLLSYYEATADGWRLYGTPLRLMNVSTTAQELMSLILKADAAVVQKYQDQIAVIVDEAGRRIWINPRTGERYGHYEAEIDVVADAPVDTVSAVGQDIGNNTTLFCGTTLCIEATGDLNLEQRKYLGEYVRLNDKVNGLRTFSCSISPTTCIRLGKGGGVTHGFLRYYY